MSRDTERECRYYFSRAAQKNVLKIRILKKMRKKIETPQFFVILQVSFLQMMQTVFPQILILCCNLEQMGEIKL